LQAFLKEVDRQERFFDLVHVKDTSVLTLKNKISNVLSYHRLDIQNIHGQGYDGVMSETLFNN
jgi:hypothetical protein